MRANDSSTFCGPTNDRNKVSMSARLRLVMTQMMARSDRGIAHQRAFVVPSRLGSVRSTRVTVVLALYDGSGWSRA